MLKGNRTGQLLPILPLLILFWSQAAAGQQAPGSAEGQEATRFDFTKSRAFPNLLAPYSSPFVPEPRLDNSRRLQDLVATAN